MRSVKTLLNHDVRKQKQIERIEKHIHLTIVLAIPFFLRRFALQNFDSKTDMKKILFVAIAAIATLITACNHSAQFTIDGTIANADSSMLYLENITGTNPVVVDSVLLDEKGNYKFTHAVPEHAQFYRLRLGNQSINLVVDSASHITCHSQLQAFANNYTVAGSEECVVMREVTIGGGRIKSIVNQALLNDGNVKVARVRIGESASSRLTYSE